MTFIDTSAIFAILDRNDANHDAAKACWFSLLDSNEPIFTTNYVVVESCALAQNRLGLNAVQTIHDDLLSVVEVVWVDQATHAAALNALLIANRRKLSLVDCVSFAVMRHRGSHVAFAFDAHFTEERFAFPAASR